MNKDFDLEAYHYDLPPDNIAQKPTDKRDQSRLFIMNMATNSRQHRIFSDIAEYIQDDDMLVVNDTRVFPARLPGRKTTGGKVEVFLLGYPAASPIQPGEAEIEALLKSSKRPKPGSTIIIDNKLSCTVRELRDGGKALLKLHFEPQANIDEILSFCGQVPLPPYITRDNGTTDEDVNRYQTVYANQPGAVAAPTAGLHFTDGLLTKLRKRGVSFGTITLHVGYGTFAPVRAQKIKEHVIHGEFVDIGKQTIAQIKKTKERGGRIWAVGTTTVRALEFAAKDGDLKPTRGWCDLYIYPGYRFKVIDNLITNFHLPESSLLFLVSSLCGRKTLLDCYREAIDKGYRFYSYGDAMAIIADRTEN